MQEGGLGLFLQGGQLLHRGGQRLHVTLVLSTCLEGRSFTKLRNTASGRRHAREPKATGEGN